MPMSNKLSSNLQTNVKFLSKNELPVFDAQANAVINPYIRWAKFILTDDRPNGNNERTPLSEFDNIINSGIHMPIKMGEGRIEPGHEDAGPIGVITNLKHIVEDGINKIIGLAAFWIKERPSDVSYIKELLDEGVDVNISWELGAKDKELAQDGVFDWRGIAVQAATIVGNPAYLGRTKILAMAAKNVDRWDEVYINNLPDTSFLYVSGSNKDSEEADASKATRLLPVKDDKGLYNLGMLQKAKADLEIASVPQDVLLSLRTLVASLLDKAEQGIDINIESGQASVPSEKITEDITVEELELLKARVAELEAALAEKDAKLAESVALASTMSTELETLRAFKSEIDMEVAKAEKLDSIKAKFAEASLTREDNYFTENAEKLLGMDAAALDFMIQELVAFGKEKEGTASAKAEEKLPNFSGETVEYSIKDIATALKNRKKSK